MFKKLFMLFKIGRKLSTSGAISSIYEVYKPPLLVKMFFFIIGFKLEEKQNNKNLSSGAKLCNALQGMGTTFIKLGQFLATILLKTNLIFVHSQSLNNTLICISS